MLCSRPTLTVHERNVPTAESAFYTLQNILGSCRVAESLANKTLAAAFEFTTQLAQSFFMPLSLTCLSIIARVRALSGQLLVDLIRMYNCCIELAALLPLEEGILTSVDAGDDGVDDKIKINRNLNTLATMPQMLRCSWTDGRPTVIQVDSTNATSDLKLNQQRPQLIITRGRDGGEGAGLSGSKRKQSNRAAAPSDLAVIEDRGVAVSREQLLAELRQQQQQQQQLNTTTAARAALPVEDTTTIAAPAYARTEVNLAATEAGVKISLVKEEKPKKKKMSGPRITIIPDDDGSDGGGGGSGGNGGNILKSKKVGRRLEPLPPRTTAFISVESLQKKPKVEEKKIEDASAAGAVSIPQPAALTTTTAPPPAGNTTEIKSWEDWLAPIGGSDKKKPQHQQQQIGSSGSGKKKKKNRRRG